MRPRRRTSGSGRGSRWPAGCPPTLANACFASPSAGPVTPRRWVSVEKIALRRLAGTKAATTMMSGKNETKALPARATLRSTNSFSSSRSQTCQSRVCSDPGTGLRHPAAGGFGGVMTGLRSARHGLTPVLVVLTSQYRAHAFEPGDRRRSWPAQRAAEAPRRPVSRSRAVGPCCLPDRAENR